MYSFSYNSLRITNTIHNCSRAHVCLVGHICWKWVFWWSTRSYWTEYGSLGCKRESLSSGDYVGRYVIYQRTLHWRLPLAPCVSHLVGWYRSTCILYHSVGTKYMINLYLSDDRYKNTWNFCKIPKQICTLVLMVHRKTSKVKLFCRRCRLNVWT